MLNLPPSTARNYARKTKPEGIGPYMSWGEKVEVQQPGFMGVIALPKPRF